MSGRASNLDGSSDEAVACLVGRAELGAALLLLLLPESELQRQWVDRPSSSGVAPAVVVVVVARAPMQADAVAATAKKEKKHSFFSRKFDVYITTQCYYAIKSCPAFLHCMYKSMTQLDVLYVLYVERSFVGFIFPLPRRSQGGSEGHNLDIFLLLIITYQTIYVQCAYVRLK